MKAYIARDNYGDHGSRVVFAETPGQAKNMAYGEFEGWVEWLDIRVRRAPEYDTWYDESGKVPIEVLLADGWHWECAALECRTQVYEDNAKIIDGVVFCKKCGGKDLSQ